jgi:ADP-ribosylglycohydrolase
MRYSLTSRFKGCVLGAILGENLFDKPQVEKTDSQNGWYKIAIRGTQSLVKLGFFESNDWLIPQQPQFSQLDNSSAAILATLPLILFFHENPVKMRHNLLQAVDMWQKDLVVRDGVLAVGYAISQCLREKLTRATLIPQTVAFIGETETRLPQLLLKVNSLLQEGSGLERLQAELSKEEKLSNTIATAFYCFLSSLEDFRLTVLRATQKSSYSKTLGAITGALSGAHNSIVGIPVTWQLTISQAELAECNIADFLEMLKLTDALAAVWSGVYELSQNVDEGRNEQCAIAAPHVIRLR